MADLPRSNIVAAWQRLSPNHRGALWMIGASLGFTVNSAFVKTLRAEDVDTFQIAFARALFSLAALAPFCYRAGAGVWRSKAPGLQLGRSLCAAVAMICGFYAVGQLPLAEFTALTFTLPLFVVVLAVAMLKEEVRWRRWLATIVGFLGVLIMVRPGAAAFDPAALVALASVLGIALAVVILKKLPAGESHVTMLIYFCFTSIALSIGPALYFWQWPTVWQWLLLAAVGVLGVGSQAMIIRAYRVGEASFVAPFDYLKLILAGLIGFLIFAEVPDAWTALGALVIVGSTFYIARREAAQRKVTATPGAAE